MIPTELIAPLTGYLNLSTNNIYKIVVIRCPQKDNRLENRGPPRAVISGSGFGNHSLRTFVINQLVYIHQKEKIALEIVGKT